MNLLDLAVKITCDDQASSRIDGVANGIKDKLKGVAAFGAKAMGAAAVAAGTGTIALGKAALDSYASFEQLSGGIDKLFGTGGKNLEEYAASVGQSVDEAQDAFNRLNSASDLVMQNAQKAYMTTGQSANEYMEQVSGFSAALVNSLGGDTVAAAEKADVAMRAIADNVNTFGSDVDSVSMAFQGFAKQNYTMLDNLKLGYGGTKSEMERLIADANEYGASIGAASDLSIDSFADIVTAIDLIQQKQNIAGTTAREAATTIEGSINSTKAAWSNLLTEFGKDEGDVGARMTELMTSIFGDGTEANPGAFGNIVPRVQQIFQSVADAIPTMMPAIQSALETSLPILVEAISTMTPLILEVVTNLITLLSEALPDLITQLVPAIVDMIPTIIEAGLQLFLGLLEALTVAGPEIIDGMYAALSSVIQTLSEYAPILLQTAGEFVMMIARAIFEHAPEILQEMISAVGNLISFVWDHKEEMLDAGLELLGGLLEAIGNIAGELIGAIGDLILGAIDSIGDFIGDMADAGFNFIMGFIDGIGNAAGDLIEAATGAVSGAVDAVLSFLGIASPSKLMKKLGDFTMEGFAEGIERTAIEAEKAMEKAAESVYDAASGEVNFTANASTSDTITPGSVMITGNEFIVRNDEDIPRIAEAISTLWQREMDGAVV